MTWRRQPQGRGDFVAAKDPQVLGFSRGISELRQEQGGTAINDKLVAAMALHEALDLYGLNTRPNRHAL